MNEDDKQDDNTTFDMYSFFSRKDVMIAMVFIIAFLIFSLAVVFAPQVV
jgi:hypothetical protein